MGHKKSGMEVTSDDKRNLAGWTAENEVNEMSAEKSVREGAVSLSEPWEALPPSSCFSHAKAGDPLSSWKSSSVDRILGDPLRQ